VLAGLESPPAERRGVELADHEDAPGPEHVCERVEDPVLLGEVVKCVDDQGGVDRRRPQRRGASVPPDAADPLGDPGEHRRGGVEDDPLGNVYRPGRPAGSPADVEDALDRPVGTFERGRERPGARRGHDHVVEWGDPIEEPQIARGHTPWTVPRGINGRVRRSPAATSRAEGRQC
jgi:hypothetical protein